MSFPNRREGVPHLGKLGIATFSRFFSENVPNRNNKGMIGLKKLKNYIGRHRNYVYKLCEFVIILVGEVA